MAILDSRMGLLVLFHQKFKFNWRHYIDGTFLIVVKIKSGSTYHICCVVVKNIQRCVCSSKSSVFHKKITLKLEKDAEESRISSTAFLTKLQMASGLKSEIGQKLV